MTQQNKEIKEVADALYASVSLGAECEECGYDAERCGSDSDAVRLSFAKELHGDGWRQVERLLCPDCVAKGLVAILLLVLSGCAGTTRQSVEVTAVYSGERPEVQACYKVNMP